MKRSLLSVGLVGAVLAGLFVIAPVGQDARGARDRDRDRDRDDRASDRRGGPEFEYAILRQRRGAQGEENWSVRWGSQVKLAKDFMSERLPDYREEGTQKGAEQSFVLDRHNQLEVLVLDQLGRDGWELIDVRDSRAIGGGADSQDTTWYFKRERD